MKTIKTKIKLSAMLLFLGVLIIPTIQSCKKYEEGPVLSLRTRAERVANTWKVENYKINSSDFTSLATNYTETFTKKGGYSYNWGSFGGTGTWAFQNHDEEIRLSGTDNQSSHTLVILKLEEDAFWYYYMDGNDKHEFHMVSN